MCYRLRYITLLLCAVIAPVVLSAQSTASTPPTLREQFDVMVKGSNRYQQFRVVPQRELDAFIQAVDDTLASKIVLTSALRDSIDAQGQRVGQLTASVASLREQIEQLKEEKDGINLLGVLVSKTTYNFVLWTIILVALAGLIFLFLRARLAVSSAQNLREDNESLGEKLAKAKKRRLEVEQDLRRKLQDEINRREQGR